MTNLRKVARGRQCQVRSPVCCGDPEQVILAHLRMVGISGMGLKAPDFLGAHCCFTCHTLVDTGRYGELELPREECELLFLRGMARTQALLFKEGLIKC